MKFKNLVSGKEVADFKEGDILILKNKRTGKEVVYIISITYNWYNLTNLHDGITFFDIDGVRHFDEMLRRIRKWFDLVGVVGNEHLELSMLEEFKHK